MMDTADLLKKIRHIQIQTTRLAQDLLAGHYHSAFKGRGLEFEEVRLYRPGDEVRTIDWNVTARMQVPYTKVFREEREIAMILLVDISASSHFQHKNRVIAEIAAVLAFSAIENHDRVSLVLCTDEVELYLPPRSGTRHVLRIIRELLAFQPKKRGTNLSKGFHFVGKLGLQRGICFAISDFINEGYENSLKLTSKKHDLITISVTDPREKTLPAQGLVTFEDLETGEVQVINTSSPSIRRSFEEATAIRLETHRQLLKKIGADGIEISTDKSYLEPIRQFFRMREKRR